MLENYRANIISRYELANEYIEKVLKQEQPENFNIYEALNKAIGNIKAQMTDFDSDKDSFIVFNNNLPHAHHYPDPNLFFSYPNYDLSSDSDLSYKPNFTGNGWYLRQYHMCMASLKLLGKYLDFLKKN